MLSVDLFESLSWVPSTFVKKRYIKGVISSLGGCPNLVKKGENHHYDFNKGHLWTFMIYCHRVWARTQWIRIHIFHSWNKTAIWCTDKNAQVNHENFFIWLSFLLEDRFRFGNMNPRYQYQQPGCYALSNHIYIYIQADTFWKWDKEYVLAWDNTITPRMYQEF